MTLLFSPAEAGGSERGPKKPTKKPSKYMSN